MQINVFDIDDAMLEELERAGLLPKVDIHASSVSEAAPAPWTGWYPGRPSNRRKPEPATRRCTGCGIDTTLPDLCYDCEESGWFEPVTTAVRPDDQRRRDAEFFAAARTTKTAGVPC